MSTPSARAWRRRLAAAGATPLVVLAALTLPPATPAGADASLTLSATASGSVLYGTPSSSTLSAANISASPLYNVAFTDVLPVGVSYVPGSSSGPSGALPDPTVVANAPTTGQTTLVWSNVTDLQASASAAIHFQLQGETQSGPHTGPDPILPGDAYTTAGSVYAQSDPRYVPSFSANGSPVPGSYTNSATASATTTVAPISSSVSNPWPKGQALRGVHHDVWTSTLTVDDNSVFATNAVSATVYVPAGIEFLGCGGVDNTTNAVGTNPGSPLEYPGAPALSAGTVLSPSVCPTPSAVTTVTNPTTAEGNVLSGTYTAVTWPLGTFAVAQSQTVEFRLGIPLTQNGTFATPPAGLGAVANLDNNTGAETFDGQGLTVVSDVTGTYTGTLGQGTNPVTSETSTPVTAVDFSLQKSLTPSQFVGGQQTHVTLPYQVGEYRYLTGTTVTDVLPSGTCPLSATTNYATDTAASQCAPVAGADPSVPYTSVTENADGSFTVIWNLGTLPPGTQGTISFTILDRPSYVSGGAPTAPVLSGDSLSDQASMTATTHATCVGDPTCSGTNPAPIFAGETTPATPTRTAGAGQLAPEPVLTKRIGLRQPAGALDCATATYVTDAQNQTPAYQAGDHVCFQLELDFPAATYTHNPVITDFLPPNTTFVAATPTAANTVVIPAGQPAVNAANPGSVTFTVGQSAYSLPGLTALPGQVFQVDVEAAIDAPPAAGNNFTLTANLLKATAVDSAGQAISLRDQASYQLSRPLLTLAKAVTAVNGVPTTGTPLVTIGDNVTYTVTLSNSGLLDAANTVVWDDLPAQVTGSAPDDCTSLVTGVSSGGTCATGTQLQWSGITVPAATLSGGTLTPGTTTLTYTMTVPATSGPGETLLNHAGVVSYTGPATYSGASTPTFYPPSNIDPLAPLDPTTTTPADATASAVTPGIRVTKTATTSVNEAGNNATSQAAIGETITYTVTATLPAGVTVDSGSLADSLGTAGAGLTYQAGTATATLDGGALPAGWSLSTASNTPTVTLPTPYATGSGHTLVLTFATTVDNTAANVAGHVIDNTADFGWHSSTGSTQSTPSTTVGVTVVEPKLTVAKTNSPGGPYAPGATVGYTVTVGNASGTNISTAHGVTVVDTLPAGMVPVTPVANGGVAVLNGGAYTITWTLASPIAPGGSVPLAYQATLPTVPVGQSTFTNNVSATATSLDLATYPGARTAGTGYAATAQNTVTVTGASIAKSVDSPTAINGVDNTYTLTVTIPGGVSFPDTTVLDTLPNGAAFDTYGTASCVHSDNSACGSDVQITPIGTPALQANGTTPIGWWLGNLSPDPLTRTIVLHYAAYPKLTYPSGGGTVAKGAVLTNTSQVAWQDTAGSAPSSVPVGSSFAHASTAATAKVTVVSPSLSLTKTASTTRPTPGVPFTYTLKLANSATNGSCAYGVTVTDPLPAGVSYVSLGTPSAGSASYNALTSTVTWDPSAAASGCTFGNGVAAGAAPTLVVTVQLAPSSGLTSNQAITNTATTSTYHGVDAATATATPSRYASYAAVHGAATVTATFPTVTAAKSTPGGPSALIGTPFPWRFTLTSGVAPA